MPPEAALFAPSPCDVLVIGGGPAGSTAAALLAARGRHVVMLEKMRQPRFHIGDALPLQNLRIFEKLGMAEAVRAIGVFKPGTSFFSDEHGNKVSFANALNATYTHSCQVRRTISSMAWLIYASIARCCATCSCSPPNRFRMRDGLVSLLAGDVHANTSRKLPVLAFKTAYGMLSLAHGMGYRLRSGKLQRMRAEMPAMSAE